MIRCWLIPFYVLYFLFYYGELLRNFGCGSQAYSCIILLNGYHNRQLFLTITPRIWHKVSSWPAFGSVAFWLISTQADICAGLDSSQIIGRFGRRKPVSCDRRQLLLNYFLLHLDRSVYSL